jgi:F5/8 type C domain-containing protein
MKKTLVLAIVAGMLLSLTGAAMADSITVGNFSFEEPGTGKLSNWEGVPNWNSDTVATNSGVDTEEFGWVVTDGQWLGFLKNTDPSVYNLTDHTISAGELFILTVDASSGYTSGGKSPLFKMTLYYDNAGSRVPVSSQTFVFSGANDYVIRDEYSITFTANLSPLSIGKKIGIELQNTASPTLSSWLVMDNVRLEKSLVSNPSPADHDTFASVTTNLSWTLDPSVDKCDVYFGTDSNVTANPKVIDGVMQTSYNPPGELDPEAIYFWRVDTYVGETLHEGDKIEWEFTTAPDGAPEEDVYYVDGTNGDDGNLGTLNEPWQTINKANSTLQAGDTVYIRAGTYADDQIMPSNSGTQENRIIYRNYGEELVELNGMGSGCAVYLNNRDYITIDGFYIHNWVRGIALYDGADYNIIENCVIEKIFGYAGSRIAYHCIDSNGLYCHDDWTIHGEYCNYNKIMGCAFLDAPDHPIYCPPEGYCDGKTYSECDADSKCTWIDTSKSDISGWVDGDGCTSNCGSLPDDHLVVDCGNGNVVADSWFGDSAHSALVVGNYAPYTVFRNNVTENGYRRGIAAVYNGQHILIEDNYNYNGAADQANNPRGQSRNQDRMYGTQGMQLGGSGAPDYVIFRRNVIHNTGTCIGVPNEHNRYYHNTFDKMIRSLSHEGQSFTDNIFKNNIFSGMGNPNVVSQSFTSGHVSIYVQPEEEIHSNLFTHNTWYPEYSFWRYKWIKSSLSELESEFPSEWPAGANLLLDPMLNDPDNHDFTLSSSSPMIDAADWLTTITSSTAGGQTSFVVVDSFYFYDGWNIPDEVGDTIKTENGQVTTIQAINYDTHTITVSPAIDIVNGEGVTLGYAGSAPDIGAYEFTGVACLPIDQANWSVEFVDSKETEGEDGAAENSFDGDPATFWCTEWSDEEPCHPHEIQIDLGGFHDICGFRYLPRQGEEAGSDNGMIDEYEFYVSGDSGNWGTAVVSGTFAYDKTEKQVSFDHTLGQYVRLIAISEVNGNPWTTMAELNVLAVQPDSDINNDGKVNIEDFAVLSVWWDNENACSSSGWCGGADFNMSRTVDFTDLTYFVENWLRQAD